MTEQDAALRDATQAEFPIPPSIRSRVTDIPALWEAYWEHRDVAHRNDLVTYYYPLVEMVVYQRHESLPRRVEMGDLVSAGSLGLLQAVETFELRHSRTFVSYASAKIRWAVQDWMRTCDGNSRQHRDVVNGKVEVKEYAQRVARARHALVHATRFSPVRDEDDGMVRDNIPMDVKASRILPDVDSRWEVDKILENMHPRSRLIVLRLLAGHTQKEIGVELGLSQCWMSTMVARIAGRLRAAGVEERFKQLATRG